MNNIEPTLREKEIAVVEAELKELRKELVAISKEIKDVKDGTTRKALFVDKKTILNDIEEAQNHLSILKGEDITLPTNELDEIIDQSDEISKLDETDNKSSETI